VMRSLSTLQSSDQFFGCKLGFGFGLAVEWRHEATYRFTRRTPFA
jgi:hypothetical protein